MLAFIRQAFLHGLIFFQRMVFLNVFFGKAIGAYAEAAIQRVSQDWRF